MFDERAFAALGAGAALLALFDSPAFAQAGSDVQVLQTAASLENLTVATYDYALTLDFVGGASALPSLRAFMTTMREQHEAHADAFNAAVRELDGEEQSDPNPVLLDVVTQARRGLTGLGTVVDLAIMLEDTAAQTYVANAGTLTDEDARKLAASIMGVEAQHVTVLRVLKTLIDANVSDQFEPPPDLATLPAPVGSVGFPDAFYKVDRARPAEEGAVA